jgi:hypothetical protein
MSQMQQSWPMWRERFRARVARPLPEIEAPRLTAVQARCLGRSLAIFQVGEAGEGRIAMQIQSYRGPGITRAYCDALGLFVAEEARHGRMLAELVDALAAPRLSAAWTDVLFTALRRLMGIRFKLLVLMAAEVVGLSFYQLIATHLEPGGFRGALEQICQDEKDHLLFHADFFQSQLISALDRLVFRLLWPLISQLALAVACFDHRQTLSSLEIHRLMFLESGRRFISQASDHCFSADSLLLRPERQRASAE